MLYKPRHPARTRAARQAFTLLEILIASILIAVLMTAVWSILDIYEDMFEQGETRSEEIQLVRSLSQQLSDDLTGAIQDPVFIDPASRGPTGARRFGLHGTANELRIDVLQIPAFELAPTPTAQEMQDTTKPRKLQAPELRTVYYAFHDSIHPESALPDDRIGLTRRELDFETPEEVTPAGQAGLGVAPLTEGVSTEDPEPESTLRQSTFEQLLDVGMDHSVTWAPEVVAMRFRYFDGSSWRGSWDSLARNGLPVAVEMTMAVASLDDADAIRGAATRMTSDTADTALLDEGVELSAQRNLPQPRVHRVVVLVPSSPLFKSRQPVKRRTAPTLSKPSALPKVIIKRSTPKKSSAPRVAPDQWMRNE